MRFFPDGLVAEYRDSTGRCRVPFDRYDGELDWFDWEVPLRGATLCGDDLEEVVEQIPRDGLLRFEVPLSFRPRGGESRVVVPVSIWTWWAPGGPRPNGKDVQFRCTCEISGREYASDAVSGGDLEGALRQLHSRLRPVGSLVACFFCKFSDYEPNTTIGHLACFVERADEYSSIAASDDNMARKYHIWGLAPYQWVDEFHHCPKFTERPEGWGYRS